MNKLAAGLALLPQLAPGAEERADLDGLVTEHTLQNGVKFLLVGGHEALEVSPESTAAGSEILARLLVWGAANGALETELRGARPAGSFEGGRGACPWT